MLSNHLFLRTVIVMYIYQNIFIKIYIIVVILIFITTVVLIIIAIIISVKKKLQHDETRT